MSSLYHGSSLNFSMNFSTIHPGQMLLRSLAFLFLLFSGIQVALARPMRRPPGTDIGFSIIKSQHMADVGLRFVADSGVCETTPGVHQMSGYIDVGENMSTWFWFFEARENPETAPFTLWLNGGPGCSSMAGLFQETGPCTVNPDGKTTAINPYSWNNISNMIYIDQPIGTGFSHGEGTFVNSTQAAAPLVWKAFQVLFQSATFSRFQSRDFIFATESYGGHFGPSFVDYFNQQNDLIRSGRLAGEEVVVRALMINNGWFDPLIQNQAYVDFATYAPGYGQLHDNSVLQELHEAYYGSGGCKELGEACYAAGNTSASDGVCKRADEFCFDNVFDIAVGDMNAEDLRQSDPPNFPPDFYADFLNQDPVRKIIGAEVEFQICRDEMFDRFTTTGDDARSTLAQLGKLADTGIRILIWAGDADINCNWLGGHAAALAMDWSGKDTLAQTLFTNMTIGGHTVAAIKNVRNFSFARVYEAGHKLPAFQPAAALEIFRQVIANEHLHSV